MIKLYNTEIEKAVLGCVILEPKLAEKVISTYTTDYFYNTTSKKLFTLMIELNTEGKMADTTILESRIKDNDQLKAFFFECVNCVTCVDWFDNYLQELTAYKIKRDIHQLGDFIKLDANLDDIPATIDILTKKISELRPAEKSDKKKELDDIIDEYHDLKIRGNEMDSGFPTLEKHINGFKRKRLYVLGGLPGSGKTGMALYLAQRIVFLKNKKVLFFSLEMSKFEIVGRLISILYKVPSWRIQQPFCMQKEDFVHLANTCGKIYKSSFELEDGVWNIGMIISKIKEFKPDIVFIDHLQFVQVKLGKYEKEHEALAGIVKNLKNTAKAENICVFAISHNRRSPAGSHQSNDDYKGSASIKEIADLGLMLIRPNKKKEVLNQKPDNYAELKIIKNRNGRSDVSASLLFNENNLHFIEFEKHGGDEFL